MRLGFAVAVCLALASWSGQAQDVEAVRTSLSMNDFAPNDEKGVEFVHRFGACIASRERPDALSSLPRSDKSKNELFDDAVASSGCASWEDSVRYSPVYLRGPIAEYYFQALRGGKTLPKRAIAIYAEPSKDEAAKLGPDVRAAVALVEVGSCVDKSQHEATVRLFDTQAGSEAEGRALANLTEALSSCIPPGVQLRFSKFILRDFLAEGAFRNAVTSTSTGG